MRAIPSSTGGTQMKSQVLKFWEYAKENWTRENGQDLTEYALCFSMIALGSVAGMNALASGLDHTFTTVATTPTTSIS